MMTTSLPGPEEARIERESADWLLLLDERPLEESESRAFQAWLAADERHTRFFSSMRKAWGDLDLIERPLPHEHGSVVSMHARPRRSGPAWFGSALAAAAAVVLVMVLPTLGRAPAEVQATQIAQIREVRLEDGSVVTLGAHSKISWRFSPNERRVVLEDGEAFFQVVHNEARPFVVEAGDAVIRDVGTSFNVNRSEARVSVSVLEGVVEVRRTPLLDTVARGPAQTLRAGERVELPRLAPIAFSAPPAAIASAITPPGAWREGRLQYNDARLGDLVADLNRYYGPGVRLADPTLGDLHVTASFRPNEVSGILDVLDQALPIEVTRTATGGFVVEAPTDARPSSP